ncbi:hypothetical protein, partial [Achromobacter insuavis]|uniref:hypothetical protein n=1 Tax=Achromobacter insuavis TaxID=1287735 RepID=UPI001F12C42C
AANASTATTRNTAGAAGGDRRKDRGMKIKRKSAAGKRGEQCGKPCGEQHDEDAPDSSSPS